MAGGAVVAVADAVSFVAAARSGAAAREEGWFAAAAAANDDDGSAAGSGCRGGCRSSRIWRCGCRLHDIMLLVLDGIRPPPPTGAFAKRGGERGRRRGGGCSLGGPPLSTGLLRSLYLVLPSPGAFEASFSPDRVRTQDICPPSNPLVLVVLVLAVAVAVAASSPILRRRTAAATKAAEADARYARRGSVTSLLFPPKEGQAPVVGRQTEQ
jgi:hypothetical protein